MSVRCTLIVLLAPIMIAAASPVVAQDVALPEVWLHSGFVSWSVRVPGTVRAELWREGVLVGSGQVESTTAGGVRVPLFVGGVAGRTAVIRPGDRIVLSGPDGSFEVPAVPLLAADVEPANHQAVVMAPSGAARLVLRRDDGSAVLDRTVEVATEPLALDLAGADIRPGDRGELTWRDAALGSFVLSVGVFSTLLRWDLAQIDGVTTVGNVVGIGVDEADGRSKGGTDIEVLNTSTWTARLALTSPLVAGDRLVTRRDRLVPGAPSNVDRDAPAAERTWIWLRAGCGGRVELRA